MQKSINEMTIDEYKEYNARLQSQKARSFDHILAKLSKYNSDQVKLFYLPKKPISHSECAMAYGVAGRNEETLILSLNDKGDGKHYGSVIFSDGILVSDIGIQIHTDRIVIY
jgi:hypothetical protein